MTQAFSPSTLGKRAPGGQGYFRRHLRTLINLLVAAWQPLPTVVKAGIIAMVRVDTAGKASNHHEISEAPMINQS